MVAGGWGSEVKRWLDEVLKMVDLRSVAPRLQPVEKAPLETFIDYWIYYTSTTVTLLIYLEFHSKKKKSN